ncbi:division/cell wall cluster transcriptional repressor MraZ [Acetobacteraceae bacterium]|nr:division/cell wall cluster transcriptional repressor MraZ [Acetobacteraceae bacterium]
MFLGTHCNRFDAKGRISIPAPFRAVLKKYAVSGQSLMILRPSHIHPCIEVWSSERFLSQTMPLAEYDPFSEEHEDLSTSLYAEAYPLDSDKEGRIIIPESLQRHALLEKEVAFMGLGRIFQIWNQGNAQKRQKEAHLKAKSLTLRNRTSLKEQESARC